MFISGMPGWFNIQYPINIIYLINRKTKTKTLPNIPVDAKKHLAICSICS